MTAYMNDDIVIACAKLVGRAGASGFEIGFMRDNVPVDEAGWYAVAFYQGTRITVDEQRSPTGAALALAERLLSGATCRCLQLVTLSDGQPGCRWRLVGDEWKPGCDAPPIAIDGPPGDYAAIERALHGNRAQRRAEKRRSR